MTPLFIDTGFLIALEATDDQFHRKALTFWEAFKADPSPLVTTSYVFDEVITFFNSRRRHAKAVEIGQHLLDSPSVQLIHIDKKLFKEGWRFQRAFLFVQHGGHTPLWAGFGFLSPHFTPCSQGKFKNFYEKALLVYPQRSKNLRPRFCQLCRGGCHSPCAL